MPPEASTQHGVAPTYVSWFLAMMSMIERIPIYLSRKSVFEMKVGGVDRMEIWFDRPFTQERWSDIFPDRAPWLVMESNTHQPVSGKAFRKMDRREDGSISERLWRVMVETAFQGIDYEDWDAGTIIREHPNAVPEHEWIGEAELLMSLSPFKGAIEIPIHVTDPFPSRMMWQGDLEAPVAEAMIWLTPPHFQALETWDLDKAERDAGKRPRQYWSGNGYSVDPALSLAFLDQFSLTTLSAGARRVISMEFGDNLNVTVGRSWTAMFSVWIDISTQFDPR